jgi:hypothetical protein
MRVLTSSLLLSLAASSLVACSSASNPAEQGPGIASSLSVGPTVIASALVSTPHGRLIVVPGFGFEDSYSDQGTKAFCFGGAIDGVCGAIDDAARAAAGAMTVESCTVSGDAVSVRYHLKGDGERDVSRVIPRCAGAGEMSGTLVVGASAHRDGHGVPVATPSLGLSFGSGEAVSSYCYVGQESDVCGVVSAEECTASDDSSGQVSVRFRAHGADMFASIDSCAGSGDNR